MLDVLIVSVAGPAAVVPGRSVGGRCDRTLEPSSPYRSEDSTAGRV